MRPARVRTRIELPVEVAGHATTATVHTFEDLIDGQEHLLIGLGTPTGIPLVRLHSECLTGDVFGSQRCDCGPQLAEAIRLIDAEGGYLVYLRQEGRGIGLYDKLAAYQLQDSGLDTYQANVALGHAPDERDYTPAAQMLLALGVSRLRLLSNNPDKVDQLSTAGVTVVQRISTGVHLSHANVAYLSAKVRHGSHDIAFPPA